MVEIRLFFSCGEPEVVSFICSRCHRETSRFLVTIHFFHAWQQMCQTNLFRAIIFISIYQNRTNGFQTPCTSGVFKLLHTDVDHMYFSSLWKSGKRRGGQGRCWTRELRPLFGSHKSAMAPYKADLATVL